MRTYVYVDGFNFYYRVVKGTRYEAAVILSDDSDLAEPIRMVKEELKLITGILTSRQRPSRSLLPYATFYKQIREGVLRASQFHNQLTDSAGTFRKPSTW